MTDQALIKIDSIHLAFGGIQVLQDVSLELRAKEILAIIGPNGSGKTSILNCINGFYRPQKGKISFKGSEITQLPSYHIAELGIARTFQNVELYLGLSVVDNILAARHHKMKTNVFTAAVYFGPTRKEEMANRRIVDEIIDLLGLTAQRNMLTGVLPYGLQKRVELGRALAQEAKVILLDEPMAGMNQEEKESMVRCVLDAYDQKGISLILVEHDMGVVMDLVDRVVVLDFGQKIAEGLPSEIKANDAVIKAYLGAAGEG